MIRTPIDMFAYSNKNQIYSCTSVLSEVYLMSDKRLSPEVKAFQEYINQHPTLREEFRKSGKPLKYYFDQWKKNQKDEPRWDHPDQTSDGNEGENVDHLQGLMRQFLSITEKIDLDRIQQQAQKLDRAIEDVQQLIKEYNSQKREGQIQRRQHPFHWFRD